MNLRDINIAFISLRYIDSVSIILETENCFIEGIKIIIVMNNEELISLLPTIAILEISF